MPLDAAPNRSAAPGLPPLAVDLKTAARLLSLCPRTVQELALHGDLPSVPVGSRRLFRVASLDRWLAAREASRPTLSVTAPNDDPQDERRADA